MIIAGASLLKNTKISGITLFPFIMLRNASDKDNAVLINHEKIHIRQQVELLIIFFYLWYGAEYLYLYLKFGNSFKAYRNISFEREAYDNEEDFNYLQNRRFWSFTEYIGTRKAYV